MKNAIKVFELMHLKGYNYFEGLSFETSQETRGIDFKFSKSSDKREFLKICVLEKQIDVWGIDIIDDKPTHETFQDFESFKNRIETCSKNNH